ncbi:hypothetical protein H9Q13_08215 [Pontibacter sp. JH31]|uniref:Fumarate reductase subunit C n=1 Tax=Pontibacter aquaedesilientis TaxID=2766980 RepID=A0ABR7XFR7_9BACT|nr:hypothetical protein [Pontibacter aquaedesilientis]MBD1397144.1 hypothetical protein [Pontibacter aquaedesilientis]
MNSTRSGTKNLRLWNSAVLVGYAFLLVLLAFVFFSPEIETAPYRKPYLSVDFIVRFSAFWFVSFLLTILVYLSNISLNYLWLPRADKLVAVRAGKLILGLGLTGAATVLTVLVLLSTFR